MMNETVARSPRIRVLMVADDDLSRSGLASLLAQERDIDVVAESPSGRSGIQLASELRPDVVLMSLRLPDLKGSEATREILKRSPTTRVLVFTVFSNRSKPSNGDDVKSAAQAGASGFLARNTPIEAIIKAVRAAAEDSRRLVPRAAKEVLAALHRSDAATQPHRALAGRLSPRELEVLRLVRRGLDNDEIAEVIGTSPRRVEQVVSIIVGKLGPPGR
jgi:DNA-binding NarL/FixJ family response regulator